MSTVRRDYRELVPLVRHRYEPNHPAVVAMRNRPRDVRLTIDAALQIRVAAIVEAHADRHTGKAAAVVLDPDSGGVLASVSYPGRYRRCAAMTLKTRASRCWIARDTVCIRRGRRSSW